MPRPSKSLEILANFIGTSPRTEQEILQKARDSKLFFGPGESVEGVLIDYQDLGLFNFDPETQRYSLRTPHVKTEPEAPTPRSQGPER